MLHEGKALSVSALSTSHLEALFTHELRHAAKQFLCAKIALVRDVFPRGCKSGRTIQSTRNYV